MRLNCMWYIVWNIGNKEKEDTRSFVSEKQAQQFANYYKSLFVLHKKGEYLQKRFGKLCLDSLKNLQIEYKLMERELPYT